MVLEFFIILSAWLALGLVVSAIFGLPLYWAVPLGVGLLIIYDLIVPWESRERLPERITTNNLMPMLLNLSFLFAVLIFDLFAVIFTIYIESGAAKMALPISKWSGELRNLFEKIGITISPSTLYGLLNTLFFFLGNLIVARYSLGVIGSLQRIIVRRTQNQETKETIEEICLMIQPLLILAFSAIITYGVLFPWMANLAKLQVAKFAWPSDFQPVYQGEEIQVIRETSDLSTILERHEGEFRKIIVTGFPYFMLSMHIFACFLTEVFLLHTQMNLGQLEARHAYVIYRIRERLIQFFNNVVVASRSAIRRFRRPRSPQPPAMHTESSRQVVLNPDPGFREPSTSETENVEITLRAEDLIPEDQPVRVIGGGETITPRIAREFPELFVVGERPDPETGEISFVIYTREFYEKVNNQGGY